MLVAALIAYFVHVFGAHEYPVGGLMAEHVGDQIKIVVTDEPRRQQALRALSAVNGGIRELNAAVADDAARVEKLIKDYESTPADFDDLFETALALRRQGVDELWERRRAMLEHIRRDEWQIIIARARADAAKRTPSTRAP